MDRPFKVIFDYLHSSQAPGTSFLGPYILAQTPNFFSFHPYRTHFSEDIPPTSYPRKRRNPKSLNDLPPTVL
jgi:hypothetical protein